jgi:predicted component of type VI protein secretion system
LTTVTTQLIFVEQEPMAGKERIPQPGATIGREGCDITLPDPEASRRHAVIRSLDGGLAIEDLGSTNGTIVNGQRTQGVTPLKDGDLVQIGNTKFRVQAPAQATQAAQAIPGGGASAPQVTAARQIPQQPPAPAAPAAPAPPAPAAPAAPAPAAPAAPAPSPQVTAPQAAPPQQPAEPPRPPAARPPAPAPPQPAAPVTAAAGGGDRRGDVPRPDFAPSAIRRSIPVPSGTPQFNAPPTVRPGGGSAATRAGATAYAFGVTVLTFVGVLIYYVTKPFE